MSETLFSEELTLEGYNPRQLTEYILAQSAKITEAERMMQLANNVLAGYGTTIDKELDKLINENEITST